MLTSMVVPQILHRLPLNGHLGQELVQEVLRFGFEALKNAFE